MANLFQRGANACHCQSTYLLILYYFYFYALALNPSRNKASSNPDTVPYFSMGEAVMEAIQQFSPAIEQDVDHVVSWQQMVAIQIEDNIETNTEQLSSDPPAEDHVGLNMGPLVPDTESQDHVGLTMDPLLPDHGSLGLQLKVGLQIGLSSHSNNQINQIFDFTLGKNRSNTIYRLRFLAFFNFVFHVIASVSYLLEFLHGVDVTYLVKFIIIIGVPIVVAVISFLVSYWPTYDQGTDERSNWITGLLVANFFTFGGHLAFNWVPTHGNGN